MTFSQYLKLAAFAGAMTLALPAHAQDETENGWSGEGSFSAGVTTGNTETTDLGLGVDATRTMNLWKFGVQASADYGETDEVETKNRIFLGTNIDRQINDRLFGFGQLTHERDEFSGFESRSFIGGGLGYEVLTGDATQWTIRGGPGLKIDETEDTMMTVGSALVLVPGETEETFGATAQSNFAHAFNENVAFTNDTSLVYADVSTQISNISAVTATLTNTLSARLSFEARHETDPVDGFEDTDTISRISLVYGFGK